jgi:hypothetical protein
MRKGRRRITTMAATSALVILVAPATIAFAQSNGDSSQVDRPNQPKPVAAGGLRADIDSSNAAERYLALTRALKPEVARAAGWIDLRNSGFAVADGADITLEQARELLVSSQEWINRFVSATKLEACDFMVHPEPMGSLQPPSQPSAGQKILPLRNALRVLLADAIRLAENGHQAAAFERLAAAWRLGGHLAERAMQEQSLITALSAMGMQSDSAAIANRILDSNPNAAAHMGLLPTELRRTPIDDLGLIKATTIGRSESFLLFASENLRDGAIGDSLLVELVETLVADSMATNLVRDIFVKGGISDKSALLPENRDVIVDAARLDENLTHQKVAAAVDRARELTTSLRENWASADSLGLLASLTEAESNDSTAVMSRAGFSVISRAWIQQREARREVERLFARLPSDQGKQREVSK